MNDAPWAPLGAVAPESLGDARLQLHHAVQLLASFSQSLADPREDDSHRSMPWLPGKGAFRSTSAADDPNHFVELDVAAFQLRWQRGSASDPLSLRGRSRDDVLAWLSERAGAALAHPEYEIPDHAVAKGAPFTPDPEALSELAGWYTDAHLVLGGVRGDHETAGPIRCWPHHFDIATLLTLPGTDGEGRTRTVGAGMTPGDDAYPAPYGYVTHWPYQWNVPRPELPAGHWHTEGWLGAVLPAPAWVEPAEATAQRRRVSDFFHAAVAASLALHGTG